METSLQFPDSVLRLAALCDFPEEGWPSMDLCAEMLLRELGPSVVRLCPPFRRRFGRLPGLAKHRFAINLDRFVNRHYDYPRCLRKRAGEFDFFHVVDHSYAHLIHVLPANRTGVYCHDLDTFRCLLTPEKEARPAWFRRMAQWKLDGLRRAGVVFYSTESVRKQIESYRLVDPARLVHAPYGVSAEFTPEGNEVQSPKSKVQRPYLLHVGSCIERKRIDVLLDVFAAVRRRFQTLRLVQVGGTWTEGQQAHIRRLGLADAVEQYRDLPRSVLAGWYRGAAMLLLPSEAEGFGLPVIEALACGSIVVASDLPVLREVGGPAALFAPVADVPAWADAVIAIMEGKATLPDRAIRLAQAARYSWRNQAATIAAAYLQLARGLPVREAQAPCGSPS